MKFRTSDISIGILFFLFFALVIYRFFWVLVPPSDSLEYVGAALNGHTVGGAWPWLDRVFLGSLLRSSYLLFPGPLAVFGPTFAISISLLTLIVISGLLYWRQGFGAAFLFLCLSTGSYLYFLFSTQIFPEPLLALLSALATFAYIRYDKLKDPKWLAVTGILTGLAATTKITGAAVFITISILMASQRKWREWLKLTLWTGVGKVIAIGSFTLFYGFQSTFDVYRSFIGDNIRQNLSGRVAYNNSVTYWDVFFDRLHFPVFILMLLFLPVYRHPKGRVFAMMGWCYFVLVYFIYWITGRGYTPIANYVYPSYLCFLIALSLAASENLILPTIQQRWRLSFAVLAAWSAGFLWFRDIDASLIFQAGFYPNLGAVQKLALNGALLILIPLLLIYSLKQKSRALIYALIISSFWGGAYAVNRAYNLYQNILIPDTQSYYELAPLLDRVNSPAFSLFLPTRSEKMDIVRLRHVYRVFFNTTVELDRKSPRHYLDLAQAMDARIAWINNMVEADQQSPQRPVLTDSP